MDRQTAALERSHRSFGHRGGRAIAALIVFLACAIYCVTPAVAAGESPGDTWVLTAAGDTPSGEEYACSNEWTWSFSGLRGITVNAAGEVYVADSGYSRICRFSSTGAFIRYLGSGGSGNGQFNNPSGIAVDSAGNVYVADWGNKRVQKLAPTGTFLQQFGSAGDADGQFHAPRGVELDSSGNVYVADQYLHRVVEFDPSGAFVRMWGKPDGTYGTGPGEFSQPYDVALDGAGNLYVADMGNARVQKFAPTGEFVTSWGSLRDRGRPV